MAIDDSMLNPFSRTFCAYAESSPPGPATWTEYIRTFHGLPTLPAVSGSKTLLLGLDHPRTSIDAF